MVMITLYVKQKKRHRCTEQTFGLWEKARVGCFKRTAPKYVYYLWWNRSPAQVGCMRQVLGHGALGRPREITPVFLPGKSHGQRRLVGYSPWGCKRSDTTEWLNNSSIALFWILPLGEWIHKKVPVPSWSMKPEGEWFQYVGLGWKSAARGQEVWGQASDKARELTHESELP